MQQNSRKSELLTMLKEKGHIVPPGTHMKKVTEKCNNLNVFLKTSEVDKLEEG